MKRVACTAFIDTVRCGTVDDCTRVVTRAEGRVLTHDVCARCRKRMALPDHDVVLGDDLFVSLYQRELQRRLLARSEKGSGGERQTEAKG